MAAIIGSIYDPLSKAVATRAEIYSRSDEAKLDDVSCLGYVDVGQLSDALLRSW